MANKNFLLGMLVLVLVFGMTVTGCDEGNGDTHTCTFTGSWKSNDTQHWRECSCGEKGSIANHSFNGSICTTCSYNNGTGNVSLTSIQTTRTGTVGNYTHRIGIPLTISNGASWTSSPGNTEKSWVTVTGITVTGWTFQADYNAIMPDILTLWYTSPAGAAIDITSGITVTINSTKLDEMKTNTNVTNSFTVGTPSSASSSSWN
jgi:hypothetical protein